MARKSKLRSFFKGFLWFLLLAVVGFNVYLWVADRFYFYTAVAKTYFVGQAGPGIYDLDYFPYETIDAAAKPSVFYRHVQDLKLNDDERAYIDSLQTTSFLVMRNEHRWRRQTDGGRLRLPSATRRQGLALRVPSGLHRDG